MNKYRTWILLAIAYSAFGNSQICSQPVSTVYSFINNSQIQIDGVIGDALLANRDGRLKHFITDSTSAMIRIFHPDSCKNTVDGWNGEHAGKWLYACSKCSRRTGNEELNGNLIKVADYLLSTQNKLGYIGTYNDTARFYSNSVKPRQTWDVWNLAYVQQGMIETYQYLKAPKYLECAKSIGDLCINTFQAEGKSLVNSGCFSGLASAGILENFVELYKLTNEKKYLDFAEYTIAQLENRPGTELVSRLLAHYDVAQIGEGKMYEMIRCVVGLTKLYEITGNTRYLNASKNAWTEIADYHTNAAGGPCGGVGINPELFNNRYMFSPYFNSETCATMDWLRLNIELLKITGEAKYAEMIEKLSYNAIPGAQFEDGEGWVYHSIMNGKRVRTSEFACCSSSGTIALEEIPEVIYATCCDTVKLNVYAPSQANFFFKKQQLRILQKTNYPFSQIVTIEVNPEKETDFCFAFRKPKWVVNPTINVNKVKTDLEIVNGYYILKKKWKKGDIIELDFTTPFYVVKKEMEYNESGWYLDGKTTFVAFYKGPLLYAVEWKDDVKSKNHPLLFNNSDPNSLIKIASPNFYDIKIDNSTFQLVPYYQVGQRKNNTYHACWFEVK